MTSSYAIGAERGELERARLNYSEAVEACFRLPHVGPVVVFKLLIAFSFGYYEPPMYFLMLGISEKGPHIYKLH